MMKAQPEEANSSAVATATLEKSITFQFSDFEKIHLRELPTEAHHISPIRHPRITT
jgi:hypothetical protein